VATVRKQTQVTLDRAQREAIRTELALRACGWGHFQYGFSHGDREYTHEQHTRLGRMIAVMDAIAWSEQPDIPGRLPIFRNWSLAARARLEAKETISSFEDMDAPGDQDLDAYHAFCKLGASESV
jgi:hypothetical protein